MGNLKELKFEEIVNTSGGCGGADPLGYDSWSCDTEANSSDDALVGIALLSGGLVGGVLGIIWSIAKK